MSELYFNYLTIGWIDQLETDCPDQIKAYGL